MNNTYLIVYMTARDRNQARHIGAALVRERLAACVNVLGPITSIYRWKESVQQDREVAFLAKTTRARWPSLLKRVREMHTYETPCVIALPIRGGNPDFLRWLAAETATPPARPTPGGARPAGRSAAGSKRVVARR